MLNLKILIWEDIIEIQERSNSMELAGNEIQKNWKFDSLTNVKNPSTQFKIRRSIVEVIFEEP